jgi:hypothetical protein
MALPFRLRSPLLWIALGTLLGLSACEMHADDGTWSGAVSSPDTAPPGYDCTANVDITHTDSIISINTLDTYCGSDSLHWTPPPFTRDGFTLYIGNMPIGQIDAYDTVHVEIPNPYDTAQYPHHADRLDLTWVLDGPDLNFTLTEWYGTVSHTMNVTLNRR